MMICLLPFCRWSVDVDDLAFVDQPVHDRSNDIGVLDEADSFVEALVGRDDKRNPFGTRRHESEEQRYLDWIELLVTYLVQY